MRSAGALMTRTSLRLVVLPFVTVAVGAPRFHVVVPLARGGQRSASGCFSSAWGSLLCGLGTARRPGRRVAFELGGDGVQRVLPEQAVLDDPGERCGQGLCLEGTAAHPAVRRLFQEAGFLQHPEVLRDGGGADVVR